MFKKSLSVLIASGLVLASSATLAAPLSLGNCLVDSLNGKERKVLAKWIFFAMGAHPEMSSYANVNGGDRVTTDKEVAALIGRLLAEDCASQLAQTRQADATAINKAFELVGRVAMQELMTNQQVTGAITNYAKYIDPRHMKAIQAGD